MNVGVLAHADNSEEIRLIGDKADDNEADDKACIDHRDKCQAWPPVLFVIRTLRAFQGGQNRHRERKICVDFDLVVQGSIVKNETLVTKDVRYACGHV
jgi:hypothetical protein